MRTQTHFLPVWHSYASMILQLVLGVEKSDGLRIFYFQIKIEKFVNFLLSLRHAYVCVCGGGGGAGRQYREDDHALFTRGQ